VREKFMGASDLDLKSRMIGGHIYRHLTRNNDLTSFGGVTARKQPRTTKSLLNFLHASLEPCSCGYGAFRSYEWKAP